MQLKVFAMVQTIRERVIIGPGGLIEIRRPELPEGAAAEVIVMIEAPEAPPPPLSSLLGRARSGYASGIGGMAPGAIPGNWVWKNDR
jgi:hypothetical protein